jgi:predicted NBD/HSP70 family sugar kinase
MVAAHQPIVIGVDIGGTKIHAAAFDSDHKMVADIRSPTVTALRPSDGHLGGPADADLVAAQVVELIGLLRDKTSQCRPVGIGLGSPGIIDRKRGTVRAAVNLGISAEPLDLVKRVSDAHAIPCTIDNDVNIAALGARQLIEPDASDLAYLSIGTGLAAGVVLNGQLRRGGSGVAGEIGHFPVAPTGPVCECGLVGCLEALASGAAITRQWPTPGTAAPAAAMFAAADGGDPRAVALRRQLAYHLALAVYLLTVTYDIDRIVIGGGVAELGAALVNQIKEQLDNMGAKSAFVDSLRIGRRLLLRPDGPVGPVGAAVLAADDLGWNPS